MTKDTHERLEDLGCMFNEDGIVVCETKANKRVAIFGSSRTNVESGLYKSIERMAAQLTKEGWTIVTGGGPGSMEAANKGANEAGGGEVTSIAHAIYLPFEEEINKYVQFHTKHDEFFSRLETFSECDAFIVTPGGIGTLLEMALIYQLVQVNHLKMKPIICVGRMWRTLRDWIENEMMDSEFLTYKEMKLIHYVDRFSEATRLLRGIVLE